MKKILLLLVVISLVGLIASVLMTQLHYKIGKTGFEEKSFCNVSEFFDCDAALASRYSQIRTRLGTIPTSELGVLFYLFLALGFGFSSFSARREATLAFLFWASLFAFGYSLVMAYLSVVKLGVLCLLCLTTYLCNFFILVLLPGAVPIHPLRAFFGPVAARSRLGLHVTATILFFGLGLVFFRGLNPRIHKATTEVPKAEYLKFFYSQPQNDLNLPPRPAWGNPRGRVSVVEFSDFQCPFCRRAAFSLKTYLKEFRNEVRFVFMNYPLDNSCNPAIPHPLHPTACLAAKAALCADQEGKFWDYHDRIFENQRRLSRATLLELAAETGIDPSRFEQCLVSEEASSRLKEDLEAGNRLEVKGTPAVFVNGRPFRDWSYPDRLRLVIESELKGGGSN